MPSALSGYVRKLNGTTVPTTRQSGGTGQAIRIAAAAGIEVFNLQDPAIVARIRKKINQIT